MPNYNYQLIDMCLRKNAGFDLRKVWNVGKRVIGGGKPANPVRSPINNIKSRIPVRGPAGGTQVHIEGPATQSRNLDIQRVKSNMIRRGIPSGYIDDNFSMGTTSDI